MNPFLSALVNEARNRGEKTQTVPPDHDGLEAEKGKGRRESNR